MHSFHVSIEEARKIQAELREKVILKNGFASIRDIKTLAGADVAFDRKNGLVFAAVVVLNVEQITDNGDFRKDTPPPFKTTETEVIEKKFAVDVLTFPYVPGFLTFREGPVLLKAFGELKEKPDLIIFDGAGIAHPRGLGLASHMGVLFGKPSIGCAKSRLVGEDITPGPLRGSWEKLVYNGKTVGSILRTRDRVKPLYVSPGHMADFKTSREICLRLSGIYRLPEPSRLAHTSVTEYKTTYLQNL